MIALLSFGQAMPVLANQASAQAVGTHDVCASSCEFTTIQSAIDAANAGDTITLGEDITTSTQVNVNKSITLDGNGHTLSPGFAKTDNSNNSAIGVTSPDVTIQNLTIDGTGGTDLHGINVYQSTNVNLTGVSIYNGFRAALNVNGSNVAATNLNTSGNLWGAVNVDPGIGVATPSIFTLNSGTLAESTQIWSDGNNVTSGSPEVTVNAPGYTKYLIGGTADTYIWSNRTLSQAAVISRDGVNTLFTTIQSAITAAIAGDTITVGTGTYTEAGQLHIDKNLTVLGTGISKPVIQPDADRFDYSAPWVLVDAGVTFNLNNVELNASNYFVAIGLRNHGNTTVTNVDFKNIRSSLSGNPYRGFAITSFGGTVPGGIGSDTHSTGGTASQLTVTGSTFSGIGRVGVIVKGTDSTAYITGNTYTGKGDGDFLDYAFEVGAGGSANITNNTISGNRGVAADTSTSAGILVTDYYGEGTTATITGNTISGSTTAIVIGYQATDNSVATIHNNKIDGNAEGLVSTNLLIDATNNWWGSASGPAHSGNAGGSGNSVSDNVTYDPWFINPGLTLLNTSVDSGTGTIDASDGNLDLPTTTPGEATLPSGTDTVVFSADKVIDLANNTQTVNVSNPVVVTPPVVGGQTVVVDKQVQLTSGTGNAITIQNSAAPDVKMEIPNSTTIYAPAAWDGTIKPPTLTATTGTAPSGFSFGGTALKVGSDAVTLVFDQAVTLLLQGVSSPVGYQATGSSTWNLIEECGGTYDSPALPTFPGECSRTNGTDTKIVTFHFTTFAALSENPAPTPTPAPAPTPTPTAGSNNQTNSTPTQVAVAEATTEQGEVAAEQDNRDISTTQTEPDDTETKPANNWSLWYGLLLGAVTVGVIYYAVVRRKRR